MRIGNLARFFGYNHRYGIGYLGDAEGGPMARSKLPAQACVLGQGQVASRSFDRIIADNNSSVMERSFRRENISQQLAGYQCIDLGAGIDNITNLCFSLDNDKRTDIVLLRRKSAR